MTMIASKSSAGFGQSPPGRPRGREKQRGPVAAPPPTQADMIVFSRNRVSYQSEMFS